MGPERGERGEVAAPPACFPAGPLLGWRPCVREHSLLGLWNWLAKTLARSICLAQTRAQPRPSPSPRQCADKRGILSLARSDDPNSGGSSFSILLGPAPHLDMKYTVFGWEGRGGAGRGGAD